MTSRLRPVRARCVPGVQRHDATGKVAPTHLLPASRMDPLRQPSLVRPGPDGFGQIDIRLRIAAHGAGHTGQGSHQVAGVESAEGPPGRCAELAPVSYTHLRAHET